MQTELRVDIQALRGLAIVLVLLYHAEFGVVESGFLGVDIFFVISGFLITKNIMEGLDQGTFSIYDFYFRRARRILPAAYTVFFLTGIAANVLLTQSLQDNFNNQLIGALTFTGNFILAEQSGYFSPDASLQPLLHVWSLAIEEQYYLLLPAALMIKSAKCRLNCIAIGICASFAYCQIELMNDPKDAFFLLQSRAWELAIGSFAALKVSWFKYANVMTIPALSILLIMPFLPPKQTHPGIDALAVCLGTAVLIHSRERLFNTGLLPRLFARIGNISYSLYLVHWPIFAFINNAWLEQAPFQVRLLAALGSICISFLLSRFVEQPCRKVPRPSPLVFLTSLFAFTFLASLPVIFQKMTEQGPDYTQIFRPNRGLAASCSQPDYRIRSECKTSDKANILLWGDSHAMHLASGLQDTGQELQQATRSACAPLIGLVRLKGKYNFPWARECLFFNDAVLESLDDQDSIDTVVLAGSFLSYVSSNNAKLAVRRPSGVLDTREPSIDLVLMALTTTIRLIHSKGKKVVLVGSPPHGEFDIARCIERVMTKKIIFGAPKECKIEKATFDQRNDPVIELYDRLEKAAVTRVIRLSESMCDARTCATVSNGTVLYRDSGHLSYDGSTAVSKWIDLPQKIEHLAQ